MEAHAAGHRERGPATTPLRRSQTTLTCPRCDHAEERAPSFVDSNECPHCRAEGRTVYMSIGFHPGSGPSLETVRSLIGRVRRGRLL
jgi:hypothetical protein